MFLAEGANAFVVGLKNLTDPFALLGREIEVANQALGNAVRGPSGIFAGAVCL